jgi:hypothetical protein
MAHFYYFWIILCIMFLWDLKRSVGESFITLTPIPLTTQGIVKREFQNVSFQKKKP